MRTGQGKRLKSGPPPKWAKFVVPGIIVVAVAAAVAGWWFFLRATPQKAVAGYVAAVKSGSESAARAFLTADTITAVDDLQKQMTTEAPQMAGNFNIAMDLAGRLGPDSKVEIGKAQMQNGVATVPVTVERGNGGQMAGKGGPAPGAAKGGAPGGAPGGARGGMRGGGRGGFQGRPRELTVKLDGGAWKIDATQQISRMKQMMAYFAANGGQAGEGGQQAGQGGQRGQGMGRGFGRGMGGMMGGMGGGGRQWGGQRGQGGQRGGAQGAAPAPAAPAAPATPGQ